MGNGTYYGPTDEEHYQSDGTVISDGNGLSGKVITEIGDTDYHSSLPVWSKSSSIYFKRADDGPHDIEQMRVYVNRHATFDFDWNHTHKEYLKGIVHVHEWRYDKNGNWVRGKRPRYMNDAELKQYGSLILRANPNVKLRP